VGCGGAWGLPVAPSPLTRLNKAVENWASCHDMSRFLELRRYIPSTRVSSRSLNTSHIRLLASYIEREVLASVAQITAISTHSITLYIDTNRMLNAKNAYRLLAIK
jgi:hypothetical protein